MPGYEFFTFRDEARPAPPPASLVTEARAWIDRHHSPPTPAQLLAAPSEKAALELHISDWGYEDMPRGWYEKDGHTVFGRYVGDAPTIFWQVAFLAPSFAAMVFRDEARPAPPPASLVTEARAWIDRHHSPPTPAQLLAAPSEKAALELHISDWGYEDMPRGWYEKDGRTVFGRYVGHAPTIFWQVAFLRPNAT